MYGLGCSTCPAQVRNQVHIQKRCAFPCIFLSIPVHFGWFCLILVLAKWCNYMLTWCCTIFVWGGRRTTVCCWHMVTLHADDVLHCISGCRNMVTVTLQSRHCAVQVRFLSFRLMSLCVSPHGHALPLMHFSDALFSMPRLQCCN